MKRIKFLFGLMAVAVALAAVPSAHAACPGVAGSPCVHVLGAGSSAIYQGLGVAAVNELAPLTPTFTGGGSIHHWTYKSACPGSGCITVLKDPRTNPDAGPIPNEPSTMWIAYTCQAAACTGGNAIDIWAYHQVDSTVGIRTFMSRPNGCGTPCNTTAVLSLITSDVEGPNAAYAGINNISATIFSHGVVSWGAGDTSCPGGSTTCDDEFVPADVWTAISGAAGANLNTGATDIRPEDGKAATKRDNGPPANKVSLGYGTVGSQLIGSAIQSHFSATFATPVEFGLPGLPDPFNGVTVPTTIEVIPVGEEPIIFITNRTDANGLGAPDVSTGGPYAFTDLEDGQGPVAPPAGNPNPVSALFSGYDCSGENAAFYDDAAIPNASLTAAGVGNFAVTNIQRESLSGTMNTTEWSMFRTHNAGLAGGSPYPINALYPLIGSNAADGPSQEYNVQANQGGANNPLNLPCQTGGGVTGVRQRAVGTGELVKEVKATKDSIGYTFFSFGNVNSISKSANYGYLTIDEVDPLFASYTGSEPGQPGNGELPACSPPACNTSSIWNNPAGSFPNLRNGTYRAWSLLRVLCDTALPSCETDQFGTHALITAAQTDISNPTSQDAVADFLPFGQASYVRAHYNIIPGAEHADPFAYYFDNPPVGTAQTLTLDVASSAPGAEQGGDAGGCILPLNVALDGGSHANDTTLYVTALTAKTATTATYSYTNVGGTALKTLFGYGHPTTISIWGFPATGNNGTFTVSAVGGAAVTVMNSGATVQTIAGGGSGAPNGSAGNGSAAGSSNTSCSQ